MEIIETEKMPWVEAKESIRAGAVSRKFIREAEISPGVGYISHLIKLGLGQPDEGVYHTPRHRHEFEQIRLVVDGELDFGDGIVCRKNEVAYFPAGALYGPQRSEGCSILILQWSNTWVTRPAQAKALEQLRARGEIIDGKFWWTDGAGTRRSQDSVNAIWEQVHGRKLTFPEPRYIKPILMRPDAFDWPDGNDTFAVKPLGRFTEHDLGISIVRWRRDGDLELADDRTELVFSLTDGLLQDGATCAARTAVWSDAGESAIVAARAGTEALLVRFPSTIAAS